MPVFRNHFCLARAHFLAKLIDGGILKRNFSIVWPMYTPKHALEPGKLPAHFGAIKINICPKATKICLRIPPRQLPSAKMSHFRFSATLSVEVVGSTARQDLASACVWSFAFWEHTATCQCHPTGLYSRTVRGCYGSAADLWDACHAC